VTYHRTLPDVEELMRPEEVAAAFKVDRKTVYRWARAGYLTAVKTPGGQYRYRKSEVMALLKRSA
jgi:excisionase family DNA binding protein